MYQTRACVPSSISLSCMDVVAFCLAFPSARHSIWLPFAILLLGAALQPHLETQQEGTFQTSRLGTNDEHKTLPNSHQHDRFAFRTAFTTLWDSA